MPESETSLNEKSIDIISNVSKYIPVITMIGFSYGLISDLFYYNHYGIDILEYAELNETILTALKDSIFFALPIFILIMFITLFLIFRLKEDDLTKENQSKPLPKWFNYINNIISITGIIFGFIVYPIICIFRNYIRTEDCLLIVSSLIWCALLRVLTKFSNNVGALKKNYTTIFIWFFTFISTANFALAGSAFRIIDIDITKADYRYTFKFEKDNVTTDSTNIYLGRTKNFIFILDNKEKKSKVYSTKDLLEVDYKLKH